MNNLQRNRTVGKIADGPSLVEPAVKFMAPGYSFFFIVLVSVEFHEFVTIDDVDSTFVHNGNILIPDKEKSFLSRRFGNIDL